MVVRRTDDEISIICQPLFNPIRHISQAAGLPDLGYFTATKHSAVIAEEVEDEDGRVKPGKVYGMAASLSGFAKMRGFAFTTDAIVFDEFIPEDNVRHLKEEAKTFFNLWESVDHNREMLTGQKPKCFLLANSNRLNNDILVQLNLVRDIIAMREKQQEILYYEQAGLVVVNIYKSPVSEKKRETSLYRLTAARGNNFEDMALANKFNDYDQTYIRPTSLKGFQPIYAIGGIICYWSPGRREWYITDHASSKPKHEYAGDNTGRWQFQRASKEILAYLSVGRVFFSDPASQIICYNYLGLKY